MTDDPQDTEDEADRLDIDDRSLCGSRLTRVDLSGSVVRMARMADAVFEDVNMAGTRIENANLSGVVLADVNLMGATIRQANLSGVAISAATLDGMTIDGILVSDLMARWNQ